jgi:uncharacterized protein YciI
MQFARPADISENAMQFDQFTVALLMLRPDAPVLDEVAAAALQDAHMAHLADLHEAGYLVAAGPLLGAPDREFRGLTILNVDPERARALKSKTRLCGPDASQCRSFPGSFRREP